MKGERGDLRRPEGEGGRSRAAEDGRPAEREGERQSGAWAGSPMGREESCEGGGSDLVRAGEIFLVLF